MILVAKMQNGEVFEASNKKKLIQDMIQFFGENDCQADQIEGIYCIYKEDKVNEFCKDVVNKIQNIIDEGVAEWRKIADEEYCGQKEIESEIRGMI